MGKENQNSDSKLLDTDFALKNLNNNNKLEKVKKEPGIYIIVNLEQELNITNTTIFSNIFKNDISIDDIIKRYNDLKECDDKKARIIYIGKSINLKSRIIQYLVPKNNHSGGRAIWKIEQINNFGIIWITLNEINDCFENFKYNYPEVLETTLLQNYRNNNNPYDNKDYDDSVVPLANKKGK